MQAIENWGVYSYGYLSEPGFSGLEGKGEYWMFGGGLNLPEPGFSGLDALIYRYG